MTNNDLKKLLTNLKKVSSLPGVAFSYAVAKNISAIQTELAPIYKAIEIKEYFQKPHKEFLQLYTDHAKKNEKGVPIKNNDGTYTVENEELFQKDIDTLEKKYAQEVEMRNKEINDFQEIMNMENTTVSLHKIKISDVPDKITQEQMGGILSIIEE